MAGSLSFNANSQREVGMVLRVGPVDCNAEAGDVNDEAMLMAKGLKHCVEVYSLLLFIIQDNYLKTLLTVAHLFLRENLGDYKAGSDSIIPCMAH